MEWEAEREAEEWIRAAGVWVSPTRLSNPGERYEPKVGRISSILSLAKLEFVSMGLFQWKSSIMFISNYIFDDLRDFKVSIIPSFRILIFHLFYD